MIWNAPKQITLAAVAASLLGLLALDGQLRPAPTGLLVAPYSALHSDSAGSRVRTAPAGPDLVSAGKNGILLGRSYKNDISPPLSTIKPILVDETLGRPIELEEPHQLPALAQKNQSPDPVVQGSFHLTAGLNPAAPSLIASWNGIYSGALPGGGGCSFCVPSDSVGDVGPNHYVQMVNNAFQVWNKTGTSLYGPANINTLWTGFGGVCETTNNGDPIVLYDQLADRWLISQFAFDWDDNSPQPPYSECIAISQSSNPTGAWYRYAFELSTTAFPDYPKFGMWPDGYYMSISSFAGGYEGPRPYVFDRMKMLAGQPATFQTTATVLSATIPPMLPADLDGSTPPPDGSPGLFLTFGTSMRLYKFQVDWSTPANTKWIYATSLTPAAFSELCPLVNGKPQPCINQPTKWWQFLDGMGDRLMNRLSYRNQGPYQSLVAAHNVMAYKNSPLNTQRAGMRWYEIRNPFGTPTIYQQSTFSPTADHRWMGSAAMNKKGDIGLAYSISSYGDDGNIGIIHPSIRFTGRLAADPLGLMTQGEGSLLNGNGDQDGSSRWGDYSSLNVDPADDCTFWYTAQYNNSGSWKWKTRIGAFRLPGCP